MENKLYDLAYETLRFGTGVLILRCVMFGNFKPPDGRGGWSNEGCYQDFNNTDDNNIVCKCNHLTNFAMLMVSAA